MSKKWLARIMTLVMLLSCIAPVTVHADAPTADTSWFDASKTEFVLNNEDELLGFAQLVTDGTYFAGKTVKLGADMDLSEVDHFMIGDPKNTSSNSFQGVFDGQGHTISNMTVHPESTSKYVGMFGGAFGATIENFTLVNPTLDLSDLGSSNKDRNGFVVGSTGTSGTVTLRNITVTGGTFVAGGSAAIGGLVGGCMCTLLIENCSVDVEMSSSVAQVGGILGYAGNNGTCTITDCTVTGTVSSTTTDVGGIIGKYSSSGALTISGCSVNATISASQHVGGILGYKSNTNATVTVSGCIVSGSVTATTTATGGSANGGACAGGVAGLVDGANSTGKVTTIHDCIVTANVSGTAHVAGVVGNYFLNKNGCELQVKDCGAYGTITATDTSARSGGIVGHVYQDTNISGTITISDCCFAGTISAVSKSIVGGILGQGNNHGTKSVAVSISDCWNFGMVSCASNATNNGRAIGRVTFESSLTLRNFVMLYPSTSITANLGTSIVTKTETGSVNLYDGAAHTLEVNNRAKLLGVAYGSKITHDVAKFTNITLQMTDDVDLAGIAFPMIGTTSRYFQGIFDGDEHTISNLTVASTTGETGMFACINGSAGGSIMDLTLDNPTVTSTYSNDLGRIGILAGRIDYGTTYTISGVKIIGGTLTAPTAGAVGGLVGTCGNGVSLTVQECSFDAAVTGKTRMGGVIGRIFSTATVENCVVSGTVESVQADTAICGGIAGDLAQSGAQLAVLHCLVQADLIANNGNYLAGILGYAGNYNITIDDSLVTSTFTGKRSTARGLCAGIGGSGTVSIANSYFDSQRSGVSDENGTGLTTAQLSGPNALISAPGLDYTGYWVAVEGGAPQLKAFRTGTPSDGTYTIDSYRSGETFTAPEAPKGKIFAGWYRDSEYTEALGADDTTGKAYAKWVDENTLYVRYQLAYGAEYADSVKIRILTTVDSMEYDHVNIVVSYNNGVEDKVVKSKNITTVWSSVSGTDTDGTQITYRPKDKVGDEYYWSADSAYITGYAFNVKSTLFDKTLTFCATWTTSDGTTVTGPTRSLRPNEEWNFLRWDAAAGTQEDPYVISTVADLYDFSTKAQNDNYAGKYIVLGNDIVINQGTASDWADNAPGREWVPIGQTASNTANGFAGTFDGKGHSISGLYLDTDARYSGLFASIAASGTVQNLSLTNSYMKSTYRDFGAIAGEGKGSFYNVYADVIMIGSGATVGGIVGLSSGEVTMAKCWFDGSLTNTLNASGGQGTGGLIGYASSGSITMTNCLNSGAIAMPDYARVSSDGEVKPYLGGLIGQMHSSVPAVINRCLNVGTITKNDAVTKAYGPLVGFCTERGNVTMSATYATDTYDVPNSDARTYSNLAVNYEVITESQAKNSAEASMPLLDWTNDWQAVSGSYPRLRMAQAGGLNVAATAADQEKLNAAYAGRTLYQGEMHNHAYTYGNGLDPQYTADTANELGEVGGGISLSKTREGDDGTVLLNTWKTEMETYNLDFAASLDHNQTIHWDVNESYASWDTGKFVYGSEGATGIKDNNYTGSMHYDMVFPNKAAFESVLNDHYAWFNYNSTTGKYTFNYTLTKSDFATLIRDVYAAGGYVNLPHPMQNNDGEGHYLTNRNDLVFNATDNSGNRIIYSMHVITYNLGVGNTRTNYDVWKALLAEGVRIYAAAGSDSHKHLSDNTLTSIYGSAAAAADKGDLIQQLRVGDYTAGSVGIKMCMYEGAETTLMGGSRDFTGNERLVIGVGAVHYNDIMNDTHKYRVDVLSDSGIVYSQQIALDGSTVIALDVDANASFYRVEVYDMNWTNDDFTSGVLIAVGNPIWNDN